MTTQAHLYKPDDALKVGASAPAGRVLPNPGSPEASAMLDSMLAEYQWPANSKNAARAGWEAANRWLCQNAATPKDAAPPGYKVPVEPVAWLVTGGRTFVDRAYVSKDQAARSIDDRKDGARLEPLYAAPSAKEDGNA